jgi:hypothetical protein
MQIEKCNLQSRSAAKLHLLCFLCCLLFKMNCLEFRPRPQCYTLRRMFRSIAISLLVLSSAATAHAAPSIELELATESGLQITAPQQWLQLLAGIGIKDVRIRSAQRSDQPRVTKAGTADRPVFRVVGIITARDQLRLPGRNFTRNDRARLKDYFDQLAADGEESVTAPRGIFGLTEAEIKSTFVDLTQPVDFESVGLNSRTAFEKLRRKLSLKVIIDGDASATLETAGPVRDEFKRLATGTTLAMLLQNNSLAFQPEKRRGEPVALYVVPLDRSEPSYRSAGKMNDANMKLWPVGWEPPETPGRTAPSLFEVLNAEIEGYTLEETLAAIGPRVKIPFYLDRRALAANDIDPSKIQVHVPRSRTSYKRVIDRALSQARLGSQVRIDEAGRPFLWISR